MRNRLLSILVITLLPVSIVNAGGIGIYFYDLNVGYVYESETAQLIGGGIGSTSVSTLHELHKLLDPKNPGELDYQCTGGQLVFDTRQNIELCATRGYLKGAGMYENRVAGMDCIKFWEGPYLCVHHDSQYYLEPLRGGGDQKCFRQAGGSARLTCIASRHVPSYRAMSSETQHSYDNIKETKKIFLQIEERAKLSDEKIQELEERILELETVLEGLSQ